MKRVRYEQFKHGQHVRVESEPNRYVVGKIAIDKDGDILFCTRDESFSDEGYECFFGLPYSEVFMYKNENVWTEGDNGFHSIEFLLKTFESLEVGDFVEATFGVQKVLGVAGNMVFLSSNNPAERDIYKEALSTHSMEKLNYKILQDPTPVEEEEVSMTLEEVAEKLGIDPNYLIITDF